MLNRLASFPFLAAVLSAVCFLATSAPAQVDVPTAAQLAAARAKSAQAAAAAPPALSALIKKLTDTHAPALDLANAVHVADDVSAGAARDGFAAVYSVPAMSPRMRLPDAFPADGRHNAGVHVIAAKNEFEPASFVVYSFLDLDKVEFKISELKSAQGAVFPAENLDLRVVKVWYQNGNAWFSYFSDVGLTLVPELLLHDENLIRVDTVKQANYARVRSGQTDREVWISAPREINVPFDHYDPGFVDAPALQPVRLDAGRFKQFVLTAEVAEKTAAGIYRGNIEVRAPGQAPMRIAVSVRVLPFELPLPRSYLDPDQDFVVSLMGCWPPLPTEHPAMMPTLKNLRRHNLLHTGPGPSRTPEQAMPNVRLMKEAGFENRPIVSRHSLPWEGTHDATPYTFDQLMTLRRAAASWAKFYRENFGHTDVYLGLGDEQSIPWVMKTRRVWRVIQEQGLKVQLAGHNYIPKAGYILDLYQSPGSPGDAEQAEHARQRHAIGHGRIGFYANQHNGSENPDFVRRQHGMLGYLAGLTAVDNYEFAYGPWNDRANELYKPMVLAYPISNGLVDTLAWEGFREGIDDMRYATKLKQAAKAAIDSGELTRVYEGKKALQWLALMRAESVDLSAARLEMIEKILRLTGVTP